MNGARLKWLSAVAGLLAVGAAAGLWSMSGRSPAITGVVVVTLDTTRADRLSPYGSMDVSLPGLERIAREGVVFERASSVAPMTLPAHASLFTGLLPPNHGVRDNADAPLDDAHTTLAETLRDSGFQTAAFVASIVVGRERGLQQGFHHYDDVPVNNRAGAEALQRRADAVIDRAIAWIEGHRSIPFFLWAHLYDAHRPYDPPEPFRSAHGSEPYLGEIAFADSQVARLVDALAQRQLLDRIVLVVAADHGESLGDHGERDHGIFVYEEVLRVPLMIRAPGLKPARVDELVRLTDVMPTVLELLGLPVPEVDGVGLLALMKGGRRDIELEAYSESLYPERLGWSPLHALRENRFKFIDAPRPELYDLDDDPFETRNVYADRREMAEAMGRRLQAIATGKHGRSGANTRGTVSPETQARLAALGYVATPIRRAPSDRRLRPDPKDCLGAREVEGRGSSRASGTICGPVPGR